MSNVLGTIREFRTAQFRVIVDAIEDYDTDLSWDDTGEMLAQVESGELIAFTARARVIHDELGELGSDYLGGCIYHELSEFQDHRECAAQTRKLQAEAEHDRIAVCGSYFSDMMACCIEEARAAIANQKAAIGSLYMRA